MSYGCFPAYSHPLRKRIGFVRTWISNCNWVVVHFFVTRQRSEPKKTCIRDCRPLCIPAASRATRKNAPAFLLNARGLSRVQTLLSPPQKGRRKLRGFLRKGQKMPRKSILSPVPSTDNGGFPTFFLKITHHIINDRF